ncbi:MAG: T9SS type A sorting domain-containing protein [Saprospiraceae bacterium]
MRNLLLLFFLSFSIATLAQPTFIGTMLPNGLYQTYNLTDLGAFQQVQMTATSSAGADARIWEFATGNYSDNWRPYTFPTTLSGFNKTINPATEAASARYNSGFGGASSFLPAITSGNTYTFNVTNYAGGVDQFMSLLETSFTPTTVSSVTASPAGDPNANVPVTLTATTATAPAVGENVILRYSTDDFSNSTLVQFAFVGSMGTAQIPGVPEGTVVKYYVYSAPLSAAAISAEVATNGEVANDMLTLNLNNNGGMPYEFTAGIELPIEMTAFTARTQEKYISLDWSTASEINNSHFLVEKSTDAKSWSLIGKVTGKGTTNAAQQYNYLDRTPVAGANYYRLQQVDFDGTATYTETVSVDWQGAEIEIFPNPASTQIFLKNETNAELAGTVELYDLTGRLILSENYRGGAINIADLEKGVYLVRLVQKGQTQQQRLLIH